MVILSFIIAHRKKRTNTISGIEAVLFKVKMPSFLTRAFLQESSIFLFEAV